MSRDLFAMGDESREVGAVEGLILAPLDRADEVNRVSVIGVGAADEVDFNAVVARPVTADEPGGAEALVREDPLDAVANDRLDRAAAEAGQDSRMRSSTMSPRPRSTRSMFGARNRSQKRRYGSCTM